MATDQELVVATLTFRRPAELRRLLPLLISQSKEVEPKPARVLVVDNDPDAGASVVVAEFAEAGVGYRHEPEPGIAAARNCALDAATDADAIVFIDDDETPSEGWLVNLVAQWRLHGAAAVGGPVVKHVDGPIDPWVRSTDLFARWQFPTGTVVEGAATNNLLLDLGVLRDLGLRFDNDFGLTGGSDTMLIKTLIRRGGRVVWCDEAQVVDPLPAQRLTRRWVLQRNFRTGNTWVRVGLALADSTSARRKARLRHTATASMNLMRGALLYLAGVATLRQALRARGACRVMSACGGLMACAGQVYGEYTRGTAGLRARIRRNASTA